MASTDSGESELVAKGPPKPCDRPDQYTRQRVQQALSYTEAFFGPKAIRKPSPITSKILQWYAAAGGKFLAADEGEGHVSKEYEDARTVIHEYEGRVHRNLFLQEAGCSEKKRERDLIDSLVRLRQRDLYPRFGDYFVMVCSQMRQKVEEQKIPGREHFGTDYEWKEVHEQLHSESEEWQRFHKNLEPEPKPGIGIPTEAEIVAAPTHAAICYVRERYMAKYWKQMISIIEIYATRNELAQLGLDKLLRKSNYYNIAKQLYLDITELE